MGLARKISYLKRIDQRVLFACVIALLFCQSRNQGCQMACFQTKNRDLGKFWRALEWKRSVYSMAIWNTLRPFGIYYGHLV
jgi:hypothetical protein